MTYRSCKHLFLTIILASCIGGYQSTAANNFFPFQILNQKKADVISRPTIACENQKIFLKSKQGQLTKCADDTMTIQSSIKDNSLIVTEGVELPREFRRGGHIGAELDGNAVIVGGTDWNDDKTVKEWLNSTVIFKNGSWVSGPALPVPLAYAMFGSDRSGLYIAGGTQDGSTSSRSVYKLSSVSENSKWQELAQLPQGSSYGSGVVINKKFYVLGGTDKGVKSNDMWVLDLQNPIKSQWRKCQSFTGVPRILSLLIPSGSYLYLLGGLANDNPLSVLKDVYRYDMDKDTWEQLSDLPMEGYAWTGQPFDEERFIITGRAYGKIDTGIWLLHLNNMSMEKVGETICPTTTAPLIKMSSKQWWLVGGEPDANKNRTGKVSVISLR